MAKAINYGRTYISFDWAMKRLLKQKANHVILEGFLSELLRQKITISTLLDTESIATEADDKTNRVDLLCKNSHDEHIIVEIQYHYQIDYFQRMLFGTSALVLEYLHKGSPYGDIKKVYSVHILYFELGQGSDYVYHGQLHFTGIHQGDRLKLNKSQYEKYGRIYAGELYPEYYLLKINNFDTLSSDSLDEWIYYFKTSELPKAYRAQGLDEVEKQLKIDAMQPKVKEQYMKHLRELNISEHVVESYWLEGKAEGREEGRAEGREEGREEGKEVGKEAGRQAHLHFILKQCVQQGYSISQIAKLVGLSETEVQALLVELK